MNKQDTKTYTDRELNLIHKGIHEKLDEIINKVDYTNGKVRRITLGLVAVGAFAVGLGLVEASSIIQFLI